MGTASFPKFGVVATSFPASRGGSWWARSTRAWWPLLVGRVVQVVRGEVAAVHYDGSHRTRGYALTSCGLLHMHSVHPFARISPGPRAHATHFTTWLCLSVQVHQRHLPLTSINAAMECSLSTISITFLVCPRYSQTLHGGIQEQSLFRASARRVSGGLLVIVRSSHGRVDLSRTGPLEDRSLGCGRDLHPSSPTDGYLVVHRGRWLLAITIDATYGQALQVPLQLE